MAAQGPVAVVEAGGDRVADAAAVIFEYMAATCAEAGWPVPGTPDQLPDVLRDEVADVAAAYRAPGAFLLACAGAGGGPVVGGVGLQARDRGDAEVKRLYVRPAKRGHGVAGQLMASVHERARAAGFGRLVLDVLPSRVAVVDFYRRLGYADTEPYADEPVPMVSLALDLSS